MGAIYGVIVVTWIQSLTLLNIVVINLKLPTLNLDGKDIPPLVSIKLGSLRLSTLTD